MSWLWSARFIIVKIVSPVLSRACSTRTLLSIAAHLSLPSAVVTNRPGISCSKSDGTGNSTARSDAGTRLSQASTATLAICSSSQSM
jgi:hypothetical protein